MSDWGPDVLKTWPPEKPEHAPPFVIVNQWNPKWPVGFATGYSFDESESSDLCVKYWQDSELTALRAELAEARGLLADVNDLHGRYFGICRMGWAEGTSDCICDVCNQVRLAEHIDRFLSRTAEDGEKTDA